MDVLDEEGSSLSPDNGHSSKTPRWWAVTPPTPAEAPEAKRRTALRSKSSIILMMAAVAALLFFALSLFSRVGRQVSGTAPAAATPAAPAQVVYGREALLSPGLPWEGRRNQATHDAGALGPGNSGAPSGRPHPSSEVFRKPGF